MTISECIQLAYLHALGKTATIAAGNSDYDRLYALADSLQKQWQNEPGVEWMSLYDLVDIGTITATDTFSLDDTIRAISQREGDSIIVTGTNGTWYYDLVRPDQLLQYKGSTVAAKRQGDLVFSEAFASTDPQIGATIKVPSFLFVEDVSSASDDVQVDDPEWLAIVMAAERVRTDLVRQSQYPNLVSLANERMQAMRERNEAQLEEIPIDEDMSDLDPNSASGAWS